MSHGSTSLAVPAGVEIVESKGTARAFADSAIDIQIATARRYPRRISECLREASDNACMNPAIAASCTYALPRDGKIITGPSIRLAEIMLNCWEHMRAATMISGEDARSVTATALALDLQKNIGFSVEAKRRITNRDGRRYNDDMILTASNAAVSIALRNAIFRIIPRVYVDDVLSAAQAVASGDSKSLADLRSRWLDAFKAKGVTEAEIFKALDVKGLDDIRSEHLIVLQGFQTSIKDGLGTLDEIFRPAPEPSPAQAPALATGDTKAAALGKRMKGEKPAEAEKPAGSGGTLFNEPTKGKGYPGD